MRKSRFVAYCLASACGLGASAAELQWNNGAGDGLWGGTSANWLSGGGQTAFSPGDTALFLGLGSGTITLEAAGVAPASITIDSAANYTLQPAVQRGGTEANPGEPLPSAGISAPGGLVKSGSGSWTVTHGNNNFGNVTVNGGLLDLRTSYNSASLGADTNQISGTITVNSGGTLRAFFANRGNGNNGQISDSTATLGGAPVVLNSGTLEFASTANQRALLLGNSIESNGVSTLRARSTAVGTNYNFAGLKVNGGTLNFSNAAGNVQSNMTAGSFEITAPATLAADFGTSSIVPPISTGSDFFRTNGHKLTVGGTNGGRVRIGGAGDIGTAGGETLNDVDLEVVAGGTLVIDSADIFGPRTSRDFQPNETLNPAGNVLVKTGGAVSINQTARGINLRYLVTEPGSAFFFSRIGLTSQEVGGSAFTTTLPPIAVQRANQFGDLGEENQTSRVGSNFIAGQPAPGTSFPLRFAGDLTIFNRGFLGNSFTIHTSDLTLEPDVPGSYTWTFEKTLGAVTTPEGALRYQMDGKILQTPGSTLNIAKTGGGRLELNNGANNYSGTTTVQAGFLSISVNGALGTAAGGTIVQAGATLIPRGIRTTSANVTTITPLNYTTAEPLQLNGLGVGGTLGALYIFEGATRFAGPVTVASNASINIPATTTINNLGGNPPTVVNNSLTFTGGVSGAGDLVKTGGGVLTLAGTGSMSGGLQLQGGSVVVSGDQEFGRVLAASGTSLVVNGTVGLTGAGGNEVSVLTNTTWTMAPSAVVETNGTDLVIDYTGTSPISVIISRLLSGQLLPTGDENGLPTTLAIAEAGDLGLTEYRGVALDETVVIAKFTYVGDANLDGQVDALDYERVDLAIGNSGVSGTAQGDLNYDGTVDALDYEQIDLNIGNGVGNPLGGGLAAVFVPEPSVAAPLAVAGVLLRRRR